MFRLDTDTDTESLINSRRALTEPLFTNLAQGNCL